MMKFKSVPSASSTYVAVLAAIAVSLAACAEAPRDLPRAAVATEDSYRLGPGDKVKVKVFGDESLSGEYQVDGAGGFTFPLVGSIKAAGMSSKELESHLDKRLREFMHSPNISLEILAYRPFYIVGEIRKPGSYPYVDGMTVINAVAIAGGFTYRAREQEFYIESKTVDKRITAAQTTRVMPGDVIIVRERYF